jgi:DNA-binding LytR/AlgR family response regulator
MSRYLNVLIIEDEKPAATRLQKLLKIIDHTIKVLDVLDSVEDSIIWLKTHKDPDLIFMDIQLSDGNSFEIFEHFESTPPVIFVTVFDKYMIQAFKVNSVDYILKPIEETDLRKSIEKYNKVKMSYSVKTNEPDIAGLLGTTEKSDKKFKVRLLLKVGQSYKTISVDDIAYISVDESGLYIFKFDKTKFFSGETLDTFESSLNPAVFFRINRQFIINIKSINAIHQYFNSRLILTLNPVFPDKIIVSREKVAAFKEWLNQ